MNGIEILPWAGHSAACTLTFDDAQPSHTAHLDALTATAAPMTFFVNSNVSFPGFDETWRRAVSAGHELGNHTASHPHLRPGEAMGPGIFGEAEAGPEAELDRCEAYIRDIAGQNGVWTFASPYGDEGWEPVAASRYPLVRSVAGGTVSADGDLSASHLPCHMAMPGETAESTFIPLVAGARAEKRWLIFCFHSILPTADNWYAGVGVDEITATVRYCQKADDVWVDTFARIGAYWLARKALSAVTPVADGSGFVWRWKVPPSFPEGVNLVITARGGSPIQRGNALKREADGTYRVSFDAGELRLEFTRESQG